MISFLSNVAETIILTIVICTILELLLPDSKNKKYIKVIMGIYLIFNIISPIINNKEILATDFNNVLNNSQSIRTESIDNKSSMDEGLEKVYKQKLDEEVEKKINELGYIANGLQIEAKLLGDNAGIYSIKANVSKMENNKKNNENTNNLAENQIKEVEKVDEVKISIGDRIKNKIAEKANNTEEEKKLQEDLANYYQINSNVVSISIN